MSCPPKAKYPRLESLTEPDVISENSEEESDDIGVCMPNNPKTATAAATSTRQASLDTFTTTKRNEESSEQNLDPRIDDLVKKVDEVLSLVSAAKQVNTKSDIIVPDIVPGNEASNLLEFLSAGNDLYRVENHNERILRCKACTEYLNTPAVQKKNLNLHAFLLVRQGDVLALTFV